MTSHFHRITFCIAVGSCLLGAGGISHISLGHRAISDHLAFVFEVVEVYPFMFKLLFASAKTDFVLVLNFPFVLIKVDCNEQDLREYLVQDLGSSFEP